MIKYIRTCASCMIVNGTDMLYMDNIEGNYIKEFEAIVSNVSEDEKGRTYLVLDRSAFYPEGGGQPTDTGVLNWVNKGFDTPNHIRVTRVSKKDRIRHYVELQEGEPIPSEGQKVNAELDWEKRYSHMKMHTAQHLVSAIAYNIYNAATVGNQIYADRSRIDLSPLSVDIFDAEMLEHQCNRLLQLNTDVHVQFQNRSVIEESGDADRCNVHLIPDFIKELRIVKIQEVELCPCAGTHVASTGEIGSIRITQIRSKGKGKIRITYELVS